MLIKEELEEMEAEIRGYTHRMRGDICTLMAIGTKFWNMGGDDLVRSKEIFDAKTRSMTAIVKKLESIAEHIRFSLPKSDGKTHSESAA